MHPGLMCPSQGRYVEVGSPSRWYGLMDGVSAALIVSVAGVTEASLASCVEFAAELDSRLVPASWLLPPRPRDGRHRPDGPVIRWLRRRVEVGDALVLHGFDHTVDPIGRWATTREARRSASRAIGTEAHGSAGRAVDTEARRSTGRARSGVTLIGRRAEFAALPYHEAALRLTAAVRVMDELGLPSEVFAPPRWLASAGTVVALRRRGFRVCAESSGVRLFDQRGGDRVLRGRVLHAGWTGRGGPAGWAARAGHVGPVRGASAEATEAWRHRALVASAARTARRGGLTRIAVEAAELGRPATRRAVLDAVDAALAAGALPASYRAPVPAPVPVPA